ncbi:MAG TPA: hypothetical protein VFK27_04885, partial [Bacillales bacterium]|nr:hypothetical protein [Bacillales bacterium]
TLGIGLLVGILTGLAGTATAYIIGAATGLTFSQLNAFSITLASVVTNIAGALILRKMIQKTSRSTLYYVLLTAGVTLLMTINDLVNPPAAEFGVMAHPVHIVVALLSIWLMPKWLNSKKPKVVNASAHKQNTVR